MADMQDSYQISLRLKEPTWLAADQAVDSI